MVGEERLSDHQRRGGYRSDQVGSLQPGKQADLVLLEAPDYRHLGYRFGTNLVPSTIKKGKIVYAQEEEEVLWLFRMGLIFYTLL